ncbi:MAG: twitch domain-containing radical SAM protein, partial [Bdellovibrionota bacterium]
MNENPIAPKLPENFCILPFTTMLVRADASISVCCINSQSATNEKGEQLHLYKDPLKEAFHSKFFKELRSDMAAGKRHPSCESCWQQDDAGMLSKRADDNVRWAHWVESSLAGKGPDSPVDVSFNLGTLCNLKCRICGSTSSSRWATEYLELFGTDHIPRNNDYIKNMPLEESRALLSNWPQKNPEITDTIFRWLPDMEKMEFLGGEPFLNPKQFEIVAKSVEIGASKKQALHFVTNSTLFPEAAARDHWPHFKY